MYELRLTNQSGLSITINVDDLNDGFTIKKVLMEDGLLHPNTAMDFCLQLYYEAKGLQFVDGIRMRCKDGTVVQISKKQVLMDFIES